MSDRSRRAVLASLAAGSVSLLAGCNSTSNSGSDPNGTASGTGTADTQPTQTQSSNSNSVIEAAKTTTTEITNSFGGTRHATVLRVSVADASVDAIALRNSAGKEVARNRLGTGTTAQFQLKKRAADTYDILAVKNGSIVDKRSKTLERKVSVEDVALVAEEGANTDKEGYERVRTIISNTGDLPVTIPVYHVYGDVPFPVEGEHAPAEDGENMPNPTVQPGDSQTLTGWKSPLVGSGDTFSCSGEKRTGEIEFKTDAGQTITVSFEYSLSGEKVSVVGGSSCSGSEVYSWTVKNRSE